MHCSAFPSQLKKLIDKYILTRMDTQKLHALCFVIAIAALYNSKASLHTDQLFILLLNSLPAVLSDELVSVCIIV